MKKFLSFLCIFIIIFTICSCKKIEKNEEQKINEELALDEKNTCEKYYDKTPVCSLIGTWNQLFGLGYQNPPFNQIVIEKDRLTISDYMRSSVEEIDLIRECSYEDPTEYVTEFKLTCLVDKKYCYNKEEDHYENITYCNGILRLVPQVDQFPYTNNYYIRDTNVPYNMFFIKVK